MMKGETGKWTGETVPYICWDRNWSVADIRARLHSAQGVERHRLMAWLMRELKTNEVWFFLKPADVYRELELIKPWLGPTRKLWDYLFRTWHELGKV